MTNSSSIRDVILFPLMRPTVKGAAGADEEEADEAEAEG
jgi:hypothetical protein